MSGSITVLEAESTWIAEAETLGYDVTVRARGFVRPQTGRPVPSLNLVRGFGLSVVVRGDDEDAWRAITSPELHERRVRSLAEGEQATRTPPRLPSPPLVTGPVASTPAGDPSRDYPQMASWADLGEYGYVEEEFFFEGEATSYATPELRDGVALSTGHRYRTRMIVRRPVESEAFNGAVVVEWLNVSAQSNVDHLWLGAAPSLMQRGYAYVGLSVQRLGIHAKLTGLREWCPARYASLDLTDGGTLFDDSLAYDLFTQGGLALRGEHGARPLGDLEPERLLCYGASQAQMQLALYFNAIQPSAGVYDGFLLATASDPSPLRPEVPAKVLKLNSETDVLRSGAYARRPDSARRRTWEVAGTSHFDEHRARARAVCEARGDIAPSPSDLCEFPPLSRVPWGHVAAAAVVQLDAWVAARAAPAVADPILLDVVAPDGSTPVRDGAGNALGGIRLSQHAVPTGVNTGLNAGPGYAHLCGVHEPFTDDRLRALYPNRDAYLARVKAVDDGNVRTGFILPEAAEENRRAAESLAVTGW